MRWVSSTIVLATMAGIVAMWDAAGGAWVPGTLLYFVDVPQLLYVALPAIAVTLLVHGGADLLAGAVVALGLAPEAERGTVVRGARALRFLGRMAWWCGVGVTMVEAVVSGHNSVSVAELFAALAVSALGMIYGFVIRVTCLVGVQLAKRQLGEFVFYGE